MPPGSQEGLSANRWVAPKAIHANANDIPEVITEDYKVRIVHGNFGAKVSPFQMVTAVNLLHVYLKPAKSIELEAKEMAFVYGLSGSGKTGGSEVKGQTLINFSQEGNLVVIDAGPEGLEFMFATAKPINEPVVYGRPFVMTTKEQMEATQKSRANGEMGELKPYQVR